MKIYNKEAMLVISFIVIATLFFIFVRAYKQCADENEAIKEASCEELENRLLEYDYMESCGMNDIATIKTYYDIKCTEKAVQK